MCHKLKAGALQCVHTIMVGMCESLKMTTVLNGVEAAVVSSTFASRKHMNRLNLEGFGLLRARVIS